mmetsp:Transcript_10597/g.17604  ORF Transcript_10597/g.17604 Transcript_10597/m.17604 type:complete len:81 (-) Transcript_10597:42-284(-)
MDLSFDLMANGIGSSSNSLQSSFTLQEPVEKNTCTKRGTGTVLSCEEIEGVCASDGVCADATKGIELCTPAMTQQSPSAC